MNEWTQLLTGSGLTGAPILVLVLSGKLIPSWVVNRQVAALEEQQVKALTALGESHQRELNSQAQAHADALAVRDREAARLGESLIYERGVKDVERGRSDALVERVAGLATEYGENQLKLLRGIREAASAPDA